MMMKVVILSVMLFALCSSADAQQQTKLPRIGYLTATSLSAVATRTEAFRQGLRELGYVDGKNIFIEWRYAEGKADYLRELAAEVVRLKVDVIVSGGSSSTRLAKETTKTIPIIMTQDSDPVGNGFVASLARPGGNITGLSTLAPEVVGKRLELLKEIVPKLSRVAVFGSSTSASSAQELRGAEPVAGALGIKLQLLDIVSPTGIATAFRSANKDRADAILALNSPVLNPHRKQIADLAAKNRLPAIYPSSEYVEAGGLTSYSVSYIDLYRRAAVYVDKILKGTKPAELPVEQPTKFEFVINLKTAKQIGLTIPQSVLYRADKVIK